MRSLIAASIILLAAQAHAQSDDETCESFGSIARSTMTSRQANVEMTKVMAVVEATFPDKQARNIVRGLVRDAYNVRRYESTEGKENAINDFVNGSIALCYDVMSKKPR